MDQVLHGLDFCYLYIDDILIPSHTLEEHKVHMRLVLQHFEQHSMLINPAKRVSCYELHFLGHHITPTGVSPLQ